VPSEVAAFRQQLAGLSSALDQERSAHQAALYEALDARRVAQEGVDRLTSDLEALRRHGSNLDPRLLAARQLLAERLQVPESRLPFVGELIQVRGDEAGWTGAIERVLGSFARTLVVPEAQYLAASEIIDAQFLGTRLVYEKVGPGAESPDGEKPGEASLLGKVELAEGPYRGWLAQRLRQRFDYACVEHPSEFRRYSRAVTRAGQVKHSATLHEKDDRRRVDDRATWVLGFSTEAKEAELERQLVAANALLARAIRAVDDLGLGGADRERRGRALAELDRIDWAELDPTALAEQLRANVARLDQLRRRP
jgi:uncharacterized protein YPO0396